MTNLTSSHDKVTHLLAEGKAVDIACLDLSKAFATVSDSSLLKKLARAWVDTDCFVKKSLDVWAQQVVLNGVKTSWHKATNSVARGSVLGTVFFDISVNDPNERIECSLSKRADYIKLGRSVGLLRGSGQAGLMAQGQFDEVQLGEVLGPTLGEQQSHATL